MDRAASPAFIEELLKSTNSPCFLLHMAFDDADVRLTDAWRNVSFAGNTFTANGHFLDFAGLSESAQLQIPSVTVTASGLDPQWVAVALNARYLDLPLQIYRAYLDYTQALITSPVLIFEGRMDGLVISDDPSGKCTCVITAGNQFADFERKAGRHTNSEEQLSFFNGDLFFENCGALNKQIKWGGK